MPSPLRNTAIAFRSGIPVLRGDGAAVGLLDAAESVAVEDHLGTPWLDVDMTVAQNMATDMTGVIHDGRGLDRRDEGAGGPDDTSGLRGDPEARTSGEVLGETVG